MIETSFSNQHLILAQISALPPQEEPSHELQTFLALTPELSSALHALKTFDLSKERNEPIDQNSPQTQALRTLSQLLENPTHYQAAISFLQSPGGDSYCVRSPGKGAALLYTLAGIRHPDIEPYLMGMLNALGNSLSPNEELMKLVGCELICASDLTTIGLTDQKTFPRNVTSLALDTFSRLICFSLSRSPELTDWIKFMNQELDRLHVLELTRSLADRLNKQHSLSGYEHITAVLKECREQDYARERLDHLSKATVRNGISTAAPSERKTVGASQEIPASYVGVVSLIPAGLQLLAGAINNLPQLGFDTAIGMAVAFAVREIVNSRLRSQQSAQQRSVPGANQDVVSWNNFFEKFDSSDYASMLKIE